MGRPANEVPTYRFHKARNCGHVVVGNDTIYFPGLFNSAESKAAYRRWLAEYLATGQVRPTVAQDGLTIDELILGFMERVIVPRFGTGRTENGEGRSYRIALRPVSELYGDCPIGDFSPLCLKRCRDQLVAAGYTRRRINQHLGRIRRMFAWGVSECLCTNDLWRSLESVDGLRKGEAVKIDRGYVKPVEGKKIRAVGLDRIRPLEGRLTPPLWAAVQLQLWTGARPGEILAMRTCDIRDDDDELPEEVRGLCWTYRPVKHKTDHLGHARLILLGPHAKAILEPWLQPGNPEAFIFSPAEAVRWKNAQRRAKATQPRRAKQMKRRETPVRQPGQRYDVQVYRIAIRRACEAAFDMPKELRRFPKGISPQRRAELKAAASAWRGQHCWHPHQLRHTAGTEIRKQYGLELARVILGHSSIQTTLLYAEEDLVKAARAMAAMG